MKLLYLFSGERKKKFSGRPSVDYPDTQLYGLNHLASFSVHAETREWSDVIRSPLLSRLLGFRLRHVCMFFVAKKYDVVFGSSLLYMMALKKIWPIRTKFVLFNLGMSRTLATHQHHPLRRRILVWLMRGFEAVVCLSQAQQVAMEKACPSLAGKVFFVPLGVDTQFYQPVYEGRTRRILSVGRDNGRDYKTVMAVAARMPDRQFDVVCSHRNLVDIDFIPPNVTIRYDLPSKELTQLYQSAEVLLLVTHADQWLDGSDCSGQTVLLDAMANGLPVVVSKKKYLEDYVADGKDAVVVDCYQPEQVVSALKCLEDTVYRRSVAYAARASVEAHFSTAHMAGALAKIFLDRV